MYIFELSYERYRNLCEILDALDSWEFIASYLKLMTSDVEAIRQSQLRGLSPTSEVLRIWAARGYAVTRLYRLLARYRQRRAMSELEVHVPEKHRIQMDIVFDNDTLQFEQQHSPKLSTPSANHSSNDQNIQNIRRSETSSMAGSSVGTPNNLMSSFQNNADLPLHNTLSVRYSEMVEATGNFAQSNVIGKGGYGIVYRGQWKHTLIAIKRIVANKSDVSIEAEKDRLRQSLMELKALSVYRHDNILPLYGYSLNGPEPCIVYQYMAGGSLDNRLSCKDLSQLINWRQRDEILQGTVRGLNFLHTILNKPLIHGDVKSANILLDHHLTPKLGDFGLSRQGAVELPEEARPLIASHVKGTLAYLPPEFIKNKLMSSKMDIYSVGVVFFECATGLRAYSTQRKPELLTTYVNKKLEDNFDLHAIVDNRVEINDMELISRLISIGMQCTNIEPNQRPTAHEILKQMSSENLI